MRERINNQGITTLSAGIDNVVTSFSVADGSFLSANGQYRIVINNEIMLVTARSGNSLTVVRGQEGTSATSHSASDVVAQIHTVGGLQEYQRQWHSRFIDDPSGYHMEMVDSTPAAINSTNFTWVNQGAATVADQTGGMYFTWDEVANNYRAFDRSYTAPFKVTAKLHPWFYTTNTAPQFGIAVRDVATDRAIAMSWAGVGGTVNKWTNLTTFNSTVFGSGTTSKIRDGAWWQIEDDNVDLFFRYSHDGINWITVFTEPRTTWVASPDRMAVFLNANPSGSVTLAGSLHAWIEE